VHAVASKRGGDFRVVGEEGSAGIFHVLRRSKKIIVQEVATSRLLRTIRKMEQTREKSRDENHEV
jgi:hypothetical protein